MVVIIVARALPQTCRAGVVRAIRIWGYRWRRVPCSKLGRDIGLRYLKQIMDGTIADRWFYSGLIRLHILHHAVEGPIFGFGIIEKLGRHGYRVSPGALYPLLHSMERMGYLRSSDERSGKWSRRVYRATPLGRRMLQDAKQEVHELFAELFQKGSAIPTARSRARSLKA